MIPKQPIGTVSFCAYGKPKPVHSVVKDTLTLFQYVNSTFFFVSSAMKTDSEYTIEAPIEVSGTDLNNFTLRTFKNRLSLFRVE